ncbi:MAG: hypothetical protein RLZZ360_255 [Candidatus Parcubacteria bacterium]|jgi:fructose-specific phosphotransferase system IIC component
MFGFIISVAYAQVTPGQREAYDFVQKLNEVILYPLIALLMGLALLIFLWGCYEYISHSAESSARETGQMHIIWGIVGMFIMLVAYGILGIAANTFGLSDELDCANDPLNANCIDSSLYVPPTCTGSGRC